MANIAKFILPRVGLLTKNIKSSLCTGVRLESNKMHSNLHKVNNWEKKFLVWTKKYKTVEEVPAMVPAETVEKARNRMRIRIANYMMAATLVACLFVAMSGRKARDRGESLTQQNLDWHKQLKEDADKAREKANASSS